MTQTRWAVDGPDGTSLELGGRKYSSNDEGAPMMCSLVCSSQGRHVHVGYCRAGVDGTCDDAEVQHLTGRVFPNPDRPKDCITHGLYWRRTGASCFQFHAYPFHDASQASKVIFSRSICKSVHRYRYLLKRNKYVGILSIAVTTLQYITISMITIFSMYIAHVR